MDEIEQGSVLFMSAEDDPSRVLKPRLMKAGGDVSKVRYQDEQFTLDERGLALVRQELTSNTPALVIIDPIIAFKQEGSNGNNATETMHLMIQLGQLARDFDTAILIVRHLRKSRADHAMHQGIGSISISARVRSGLIHAPHPDNPKNGQLYTRSQTIQKQVPPSSLKWKAMDRDLIRKSYGMSATPI